MRSGRRGAVAWLGATLLAAGPVLAHDFWIEPSTFHPTVGSALQVRLRVGQDFQGDPVPRNPALIEKFVLCGPGGERAVVGREGQDPAGLVGVEEVGLLVLGFRSLPSPIELEAVKFERYLHDEGLETVIARRAATGETGRPGREIFSRCAKAILQARGAAGSEAPGRAAASRQGAAGFDRVLGFRLEIVPEKDPYAPGKIATLPVRLLFDGKPLAGALVVAMNEAAPDQKERLRTDRNGRVQVALDRGGAWLVKAVHMVPAPADAPADWESLWASLTFER